ncbi:MAG: D-alanyl-D-alanine carboxypeptidase/D-alanyl-D-alanine-endopeptidase [Castellaniella sp.]|uniref:D-alanyl-D-alanine carboxypeptidase/D-alanyl-D-alanine endopeptidase n=1 Tax=Castellaniella sp. TaxID=1955812 RepID=UPI002A36974F|nr:D-alanyl-D-alanine carboxypeptidase/D-alanyl-D-alanine-endopeptidase [Castellaniella sp.]MDY0308867.1 D-alanyl-D-alanine carboxypeptidase/D-alanyl-D-alanine-endopeptidase [Castellaniella sp.]
MRLAGWCEPQARWNRFRAVLAACLLAGVSLGAGAQALPPELQRAWQATRLPLSSLSLEIREAGGPVIARIQADQPRNPASVMKTVTTWAALSALGPDYVWRTRLLSDPGARVDEQGTLQGPLYVQAGGDPWFRQEDLWNLLRELRLRGVKNLSEVVVDRSRFGDVAIDPGDFDDAPDRPYNASPDAMMVNFGATRLVFLPDARSRQWVPLLDPPTRNVRVEGRLEWQDGTCKGSPVVAADVRPEGPRSIIHVAGKAVGSCGEFSVYRLAGSQDDHFEALFRLLWRELGGTLARGIRAGRVPARATALAWHDSPSLADVIRQINKHSNNVMARMTLLTLGAELNGPGATTDSGGRAVRQILKNQGVDTTGWTLDNGSGLSRQGRVTARGLAQMLDVAWRSPLMPEFVSSLAISGVDGTVRRRLRSEDTRGQAHLKTGTLRDSRALAGYVRGASGKRYILVSLVNDPGAAAVRPFDDALVEWLAAR